MASRRKQPDPEKVVKGGTLNHNAAIEIRYANQLDRLVAEMTQETQRELMRLFQSDNAKEQIGQDASISQSAKVLMNALKKRFIALFAKQADPLARGMLEAVNRESAANIKRTLPEAVKGLTLNSTKAIEPVKNVMIASVAENVDLIKSIPQQFLSGVQQAVMRSITTGNGIQDLKPYLEKQAPITERRARLIANDQTRKAYNNLNAARMKASGVRKFEWIHSAGGRDPRELHITPYPAGLNGGIFSFDDLPVIDDRTGERGLPGQAVNCRCRMRPILDFGDDEK